MRAARSLAVPFPRATFDSLFSLFCRVTLREPVTPRRTEREMPCEREMCGVLCRRLRAVRLWRADGALKCRTDGADRMDGAERKDGAECMERPIDPPMDRPPPPPPPPPPPRPLCWASAVV